MSAKSPQRGYNHNIPHRGRLYHVQTEDSGVGRRHIFTHVFYDGTIVASNKVDYETPGDSAKAVENLVVGLMQESHKAMIRGLRRGEFDEKIIRVIGEHPIQVSPASPADPSSAAPASDFAVNVPISASEAAVPAQARDGRLLRTTDHVREATSPLRREVTTALTRETAPARETVSARETARARETPLPPLASAPLPTVAAEARPTAEARPNREPRHLLRPPPSPRVFAPLGPPLTHGTPAPVPDPTLCHPTCSTPAAQAQMAAHWARKNSDEVGSAPVRQSGQRHRRALHGIGGSGVAPATENAAALKSRDIFVGELEGELDSKSLDEEINELLRDE